MLSIICKQLLNRWRANIWILVELLLVFCLVWYMADYFFVLQYNRSLPSNRDVGHTWYVDVSQLPAGASGYLSGESDSTALEVNFSRVLDRIHQAEGVEALVVLDGMSYPGSGGYNETSVKSRPDSTAITVNGQLVSFDPQTDYFKTFHLTTPDGVPVTGKDFDLSAPRSVVISQSAAASLFPGQNAVGKNIYRSSDPEDYYVVKGVVADTKRFDYERPLFTFYLPLRVDAANIDEMCIGIRSSESISDTRFLQMFNEKMKAELRIGNFYFKRMQSFGSIAKEMDATFGMTNGNRVRTALMLFFLLNIMLCVIGTFWYRISQRRNEIGLRMALGSTHAGIRSLFYRETLCLLAVAALPALLIEAQFVYAGLIDTLGKDDRIYLPDRLLLRFLITNAITFFFLALAILSAVWLPARKASRMAPAEALHYE